MNQSIVNKKIIEDYFYQFKGYVFKYTEIRKIYKENKSAWVKENSSFEKFIKYLIKETGLKEIILEFPFRKEIRYTWENNYFYKTLMSLGTNAYVTHSTAMELNGLIENITNTFYVNVEQKPKKNQKQENIDKAFQNRVRVSSNIAEYDGKRICIHNGKYSRSLGVIELIKDNGELVRITDVERTLIDITVRPVYAGGVLEVLKAFKRAKGKVTIDKIVEYLIKLDYTYPYHQCVGFYLKKSGYKDSELKELRNMGFKFDFYLEHKMNEVEYSQEWRIFYPKILTVDETIK